MKQCFHLLTSSTKSITELQTFHSVMIRFYLHRTAAALYEELYPQPLALDSVSCGGQILLFNHSAFFLLHKSGQPYK